MGYLSRNDPRQPGIFLLKVIKAKLSGAFLLFICFTGCVQKNNGKLILEKQLMLDSIPSGSGLAVKNDSAFIISDDGTSVYLVSLNTAGYRKIVYTGQRSHHLRQGKSEKHDLETATLVQWNGSEYLIAAGSGTKAFTREQLLAIAMSDYDSQQWFSLRRLYRQLQSITGVDSSEWNLEGMAVAGDRLVFLNRGSNMIIQIRLNDFFNYVWKQDTVLSDITYSRVNMPAIDQHEARLSGAVQLDEKRLLICASVEDTPDWTSDGPVLGSYIGIYSLHDRKLESYDLLKDGNGHPLKQKLESVAILHQGAQGTRILAVADNDNGTSTLFWFNYHD